MLRTYQDPENRQPSSYVQVPATQKPVTLAASKSKAKQVAKAFDDAYTITQKKHFADRWDHTAPAAVAAHPPKDAETIPETQQEEIPIGRLGFNENMEEVTASPPLFTSLTPLLDIQQFAASPENISAPSSEDYLNRMFDLRQVLWHYIWVLL